MLSPVSAPAAAQADSACPPARTALVLSGGGAKGLAHIGVLRRLDSLGIRPDLVVGTSMGSLVGALYASGYSGHQVDSIARALPLESFFGGYEPRAVLTSGLPKPLVLWEQGKRGFDLTNKVVREPELNALISAIFLKGNLYARGSFDSLPIPLRVTATDLDTRDLMVLGSGDLAQSVRASMSIPLVFTPIVIDGSPLVDGGISANVPVGVARSLGATRVIVSDVSTPINDSVNYASPIAVLNQMVDFLVVSTFDSLRAGDIYIHPDVSRFSTLDFAEPLVNKIIGEGERAADSVLTGSVCLAPLGGLPSPVAPTRVGLITPNDGAPLNTQLLHALQLAPGNVLDVPDLSARLIAVGQSEIYNEIWLNPGGDDQTVTFAPRAQPGARRIAGVGLAWDLDLGAEAWGGVVDRRLFGTKVQGSGAVFLGQIQSQVVLAARRAYEFKTHVVPAATLSATRQNILQFDSAGGTLPSLVTREALLEPVIERYFRRAWLVSLGIEGRVWQDTSAAALGAAGGAIHVKQLAEVDYPVRVDLAATTRYQRVFLAGSAGVKIGSVGLRPHARIGWGSTGLPLQLTFPLNGDEGIPGYHITEFRGNRETTVGLLLTQPLFKPLGVRVDGVGGRSATGGPLFATTDWKWGVRFGLDAATPIGPVRFEYGLAGQGRHALFVRVGRWF